MKYRLIFLLLLLPFFLPAQDGLKVKNNEKKAIIPFQFINNLIFIPVNVNGVELTFLLDTGVSETILFSLENKEINFDHLEKMKFTGLGENIEIQGLKSINNVMKIGESLQDNRHSIYIILDENFNFSSHVGIPVNGIIGYQFFRNHPVKIDYITKKITVYQENKAFTKAKKGYSSLPITLEYDKPYVIADVEMTNEKTPSKLLIDLGNSDSVWLFPALIKNFVYNRPFIDDFLGRGFNGDIFGKRSRIKSISLGENELPKPIATMPDEYSIQHIKLAKDRKGSIGDDILRRFSVIFDYPNKTIYFKKNKNYTDPFHFNMSGLDIRQDGLSWEKDMVKVENPTATSAANSEVSAYSSQGEFKYKFTLKPNFSIAGSRKDSPSYKAGVRKDDVLLKINGQNTKEMTLEKINILMKSEEGKKIILQISRNGQIIEIEFYLEDPIPYQET